MTFPAQSLALARELLGVCEARGWHLATAESCTGGLIIGCLTEIAGSSSVVERGYVTYDNRAKQELVGVPAELLERVGAVSEEVARAMVQGALENSEADIALAVTGVAGPDSDEKGNPVGLVYIAIAHRGGETLCRKHKFGDIGRAKIRSEAAKEALALIETTAKDQA
jgi:nicotinamide-nucleotide amidase